MVEEETRETTVPDEIGDFVELLKDHEVKANKALAMSKFISKTGSPEVFEQPEELASFLARYPRDLAPVQRRRILEQWFAEKGVSVPEDLLTKTAMHSKELAQAEKEEAGKKKITEKTVWTVDIDDRGMPKIRMIKDVDEPGTTLAEATKAAKEIVRDSGGEEALVIYNDNLGKHMPNTKSDFVKKNLAVAWAAAKQMDEAMDAGTPADPMEVIVEQMARVEAMKEAIGVGKAEPKGSLGEVVSALKDLWDMTGAEGKLPDWLSDPLSFQKTIQSLVPTGDNEALKAVREELSQVREEMHQTELTRKNEQINLLVNEIQNYRSEVGSLKTDIEQNRNQAGRTAYDLIGQAIEKLDKKVPDKEDIKSMIAETVRHGTQLSTRGIAERGKELEGMAAGMEAVAEIKTIEDSWFRFS